MRFKDIRRVYSHPVALNQCLRFFSRNPSLERVPYYDTAGSVKMVMAEKLSDAARHRLVGGRRRFTGRRYPAAIHRGRPPQLHPVFPALFGQTGPALLPRDKTQWKTSVVFTTRNIPGALFRAISAFALRDLNLTKIESRPLHGKPWEYLFYLDFLGREDEPRVQNALRHLAELADFLRVLGSYPQGS